MWQSFTILVGALGGITRAQTPTRDGLVLCPLKGQQFPVPSGLAQETVWQETAKSLRDTLEANITQTPYNATTFSVGIFSTTDAGLLFEYHHGDQTVVTSKLGANKVDADSIYRIASLSKILTIYLWLIRDGDRRLSDPIIEHIPQLATFDVSQVDYPLPDWSEITVGDLMSFLAGAGRDYGLNDLAISGSVTGGLPELAAQNLMNDTTSRQRPTCGFVEAGLYLECNQDEYIRALSQLGASFPSSTTPLYSNANWAILGLALSNLLESPMEHIFNTSLVNPLNLTGTTYSTPKHVTRHSVVPDGNTSYCRWDDELGPIAPAAGAYSTTNDLAAIGKAILNSTLVSKSITRRWFAATSFVDKIDQAVGRGWEIFRLKSGGHTVDLYTKGGNWGSYSSVFAVIPDYNVGFSLLSVSTKAYGKFTDDFPNVLAPILLDAVEKIGREQANHNFVGQYHSQSSNTSVRVEMDDLPGLKLTEYIYKGTDMGVVFGDLNKEVDFRLIPNHLAKGKGQFGFTGVYARPQPPLANGSFYFPCQSWLDIDDFTYDSVPLGNFMFEVDENGRAGSVQLKAFKEKLERKLGIRDKNMA
ncbi:uncharacterized protein RCC_12046 [Ramularia collo-cygni]|uniref:Uncharacterized protein n=1 Tax=Ramularia collo-cygni TaxID=112498 RepID=A0A2D3ULZ9_9PEZI|nr:uncharacterized protein RCC_12046 [Ramularia collo-cygni]CZT14561.1 uncharacterized protein RCC_12046 [Ramularia collo-cygni]